MKIWNRAEQSLKGVFGFFGKSCLTLPSDKLMLDGVRWLHTLGGINNLTSLRVAFGHAQCDVSRRLHDVLDVLLLESSSSSLPPVGSVFLYLVEPPQLLGMRKDDP